jgi:hypothetical protein
LYGIINRFIDFEPVIKFTEKTQLLQFEVHLHILHAGSYGGWNTKPGIQYVPNGRRPVAPFSYSRGGSPVIDEKSREGEGFFYASIPASKKFMHTLFENVANEPLPISITINDRKKENYVIPPKEKLTVKNDISSTKGEINNTSQFPE